jgi:hypothetical protein
LLSPQLPLLPPHDPPLLLPPQPPPLLLPPLLLPQPLQSPPLQSPPLQLPHSPPLPEELLLQPPPELPLLLSDEHESQDPPLLEHVLSQDSELPQLGPEQSQLGDASQLVLLSLHESPQLTLVERGGSEGMPPSTPGNVVRGAP